MLSLSLPRDRLSIPVARRVLSGALSAVGVRDGTVHDMGVALTEACTNVLDHAVGDDEYEVNAGLDAESCVIEVVDTGHGFDAEQLALVGRPGAGQPAVEMTAEQGRGLVLMRALVENLQVENAPARGAIVRFAKRIEADEGAPVRRLSRHRP